MDMHPDQPSKDDDFQRRPFATRIAHIISKQTDPSPLVVAINGAWGEGKSTVFGYLSTALSEQNVPVLAFNAWEHSTEDGMLRAFFVGLAEAIDSPLFTKGEKLFDDVKKKLGWLGNIMTESAMMLPGGSLSGTATQTAGNKLDSWLTPTLSELRRRVRNKLNENGKRLAVLIDDPDRLDEAELFALLRLVKLTADFDYVTFVLAMDYDAVAKTVGRRFGGDDHGYRFLEKIVQVSLKLPAISQARMRSYVVGLVNQVITDLGLDIPEHEGKRFHEVFQPLLMPRIRTPRIAKQYANVLRFTLGMLEPSEFNITDVILLEGIRLFYPDAFLRLANRIISEESIFSVEDLFSDGEKRRENAFAALLPDNWPEADRKLLRNALVCLFPRQLSNHSISEERYKELARQRRVTCDEYLLRYLAAAIPENDVADAEIEEVIKLAESAAVVEITERLRPLMASPASVVCMKKLRIRESLFTPQQNLALVEAVVSASDVLQRKKTPDQAHLAFGQAAYFVAHCIAIIADTEEREALAKRLLLASPSIVWGWELLRGLPKKSQKGRDAEDSKEHLFSLEEIRRLSGYLAERIQSHYKPMTALPDQEELHDTLWVWARYGNQEELRSWTRKWLEQDHSFLDTVVSAIMTWSYSFEDNERGYTWPGDDSVREWGPIFLDAPWVIERFNPPEPPPRSFWSHDMTIKECTYQLLFVLKGGRRGEDDEEGVGDEGAGD